MHASHVLFPAVSNANGFRVTGHRHRDVLKLSKDAVAVRRHKRPKRRMLWHASEELGLSVAFSFSAIFKRFCPGRRPDNSVSNQALGLLPSFRVTVGAGAKLAIGAVGTKVKAIRDEDVLPIGHPGALVAFFDCWRGKVWVNDLRGLRRLVRGHREPCARQRHAVVQ